MTLPRGSAAAAERRARKLCGLPLYPMPVMPYSIGPLPKTCQWIEGEPSVDDACKCGAPVQEGRPYCPDHQARTVVMAPKPNVSPGFAQKGWAA